MGGSKPRRDVSVASDVFTHFLPGAQFTRFVERTFEKENPEKSIAWPRRPIPDWADAFKPKVLLDLGSGLGAQTSATLSRLAHWGCLEKLERVVLVDCDKELHNHGGRGLKLFLESRTGHTLRGLGLRDVNVEAFVKRLSVIRKADGQLDVSPLAEICPKADLILVSHVTYYFGDGSGYELLDGIARHRLLSGGRLWVNIRDLNCPVYQKRRAVLSALGITEPQPFDYSEYFLSAVVPRLPNLELLDRATIDVNVRPGEDRARAARFLMWRMDVESGEEAMQPLFDAGTQCSAENGPLYSETQFILAKV